MSAKKNALTLEFPDNALAAALSGPHAKHLARIEQKLDAGIDMRGKKIAPLAYRDGGRSASGEIVNFRAEGRRGLHLRRDCRMFVDEIK